jgi:PAS domain S-box-containing protein
MYQLIDKLAFHIVIIEGDRIDGEAIVQPRITQINDAVTTFLGYSKNELIGKPLELIFSADDNRLFSKMDICSLEGKSFEGQLITQTANRINALMSLSCLSESHSKYDRIMLLFQNINGNKLINQETLARITDAEDTVFQCKEIESALAESEERFRQMAEMTGEWLWEQDNQGYYIYSSTAVQQILGFTQQEVIGKHYTELLTPQDKANQKSYATSQQPFYAITNHYRHKDGHLVMTESTGLPIINAEKKLIKWRGADHDVTARKHFQDALMESEKRIRLIIESSINAIVIMDSYGIITDWNRRAENMFGWSSQEAIGQRLAELIIPARFRQAHREGMQLFMQTGNGPILSRQIEHIGLRRDGTEFPVELFVSPLKLDNFYIFAGFVHDISSRKAAEQQIREAQINLAITQNEIKIAQQIQATLLPAGPIKTVDFEVTGICLPADKVGGDYFDYFFRSDDLLDVVIADVSGHSIGPSLFMVETRSAIRAQANRTGSPSETLKLLNNFLYHDLNNSDFFISLFYLQYDVHKQELSFANAGHPPPLWLSPQQNKCKQLDTEGLILGVYENVIFEEKKIRLAKGDLILVYTDGLTEAENADGEFFGLERVNEIFIAHSHQAPQKIIDALLKQLKAFCQKDLFNDDITLMVFKRNE